MWPIINHTNKNAFLGTTFICLDIYKKFHRFLHTFSGPNAIPADQLSKCNQLPLRSKKTIPITHTNKFSIFVAKNKLFPQMLLAAYASSKEVIYITTTQIQKSSLDCIQIGPSNYMGQ
ncbi:unnamed protein product [Brassica oleracea]